MSDMQKNRRTYHWLVVAFLMGPMTAVAGVAEDLVTLHLDAIGGESRVQSLQSVCRKGYNLFEERRIPLLVCSAESDLIRIEMDLGKAGKLIQGYDGETAWKVRIRGDELIEETFLPQEAEQLIHDAIFRDSLLDLRTPENTLEYMGEEVRGENRFYLIAVVEPDGHRSDLEMDAETYQVVRQFSTQYLRGRKVSSVMTYSDFRPVAGVWLPHRIQTVLDERLTFMTVYESMEGNPSFRKGWFQCPKKMAESEGPRTLDEEKS
ncbi:MAG: hypothetical protein JKY51_03405 [Opitutaceae bacterium]|nr:hypothetical protein [Opitutaceae bacterium]